MTKNDYQKPTMKVVKLQHRSHLLTVSGPAKLEGTEEEWQELE